MNEPLPIHQRLIKLLSIDNLFNLHFWKINYINHKFRHIAVLMKAKWMFN